MLSCSTAAISAVLTFGLVSLCWAAPSFAADAPGPFGDVKCDDAGQAGCDVKAQAPGADRAPAPPSATSQLGGGVAGRLAGSRPADAGALAISRLNLPAPLVASSPSPQVTHLVGLPAWFWVPTSWWTARSATAAVPGLTVTATAVPVQVVWTTGDGGRVVCEGPGTPWRAGMDASKPSPDCGHTYTESSASQPGGVFRLVATVVWRVTWAGGGQSGQVPALGTSTVTTVRVGESQALVVPQR